jgi:hypothetical protein
MKLKLVVFGILLLLLCVSAGAPRPAEAAPCCLCEQFTDYNTHYVDYCADAWSNCVSERINIECWC